MNKKALIIIFSLVLVSLAIFLIGSLNKKNEIVENHDKKTSPTPTQIISKAILISLVKGEKEGQYVLDSQRIISGKADSCKNEPNNNFIFLEVFGSNDELLFRCKKSILQTIHVDAGSDTELNELETTSLADSLTYSVPYFDNVSKIVIKKIDGTVLDSELFKQ